METWSWLTGMWEALTSPFFHLLDQRNLYSYIGAAIFVFLAAIAIRFRRGRREFRLRAFWRLLTRRSVWRHRSAKLDYKLYLINLPIIAFVLAYLIVGSAFWSGVFGNGLTGLFGAPTEASGAHWTAVVLVALFLLLAFDFGYWLGHYWMHRSAILWQFHKLHHSAEVMTPATEYRQHPVELLLIPTVVALIVGLALALLTRWFGGEAATLGGYGFNIIAVIHMLTFHHVRHSHIAMPFTGAMGVIFHSPAHHHLHHSSDPAHFNCNMGYMLSLWDWAAGTLRMPARGMRLRLGIGAEGGGHATVRGAMWTPFRDAWVVVRRPGSKPSATVMRDDAAATPSGRGDVSHPLTPSDLARASRSAPGRP